MHIIVHITFFFSEHRTRINCAATFTEPQPSTKKFMKHENQKILLTILSFNTKYDSSTIVLTITPSLS